MIQLIANKKINILHLILGIVITVAGTILQIYDWWINFGDIRDSHLLTISFLISLSGFIFTFKAISNSSIAYFLGILYPLFIMLLYHIIFVVYFEPKINNDNVRLITVIDNIFEKYEGDGVPSRAVAYSYSVNGIKYTKSFRDNNLKKGDTLKIRYYIKNPNFHIIKNEK